MENITKDKKVTKIDAPNRPVPKVVEDQLVNKKLYEQLCGYGCTTESMLIIQLLMTMNNKLDMFVTAFQSNEPRPKGK